MYSVLLPGAYPEFIQSSAVLSPLSARQPPNTRCGSRTVAAAELVVVAFRSSGLWRSNYTSEPFLASLHFGRVET